MKTPGTFMRTAILATISTLMAACASQQLSLGGKERIVFLGDSITELGVKPNGYVTLIRQHLKKGLPGTEVIGAGISGNKVTDLQKRLDKDVLKKKPTVVVIYIGINDVWHFALKGLKGTPKEQFEAGLTDIIGRCQKAKARVVLCTPTVIGEKVNHGNPQDAMLDEYADISRRVAEKTGAVLCDLRKEFLEYLKEMNRRNKEKGLLTTDRVHLNDAGNELVAETISTALGI